MKPDMDEAELNFFKNLQELIGSPAPKIKNRFPQTSKTICGVDAAYETSSNRVLAAAALFVDGNLKETGFYSGTFTFPYFPGLFFLHEGPFVVAAIRNLKTIPALVCFDAHGTAHPRMKGLATICGMMLGVRSIGIAKSRLIGESIPNREGLVIENHQRKLGYETQNPKRYWSPGFSVTLQELKRVIHSQNRITCLSSMAAAHDLAINGLRQSLTRSSDL